MSLQLSESDFVRILEAAKAVNSTISYSELMQTVMRLASEVVRSEVSSLLLLDPVTEELYFDVVLGEKSETLHPVRLKKGEGIAGWVALHGEPVMVNDVLKDPRWTQRGDKASRFQTRSIIAVPLVAREKRVGVLEAINRVDGKPFSERDLKVFEFFSAQVAVAIENAKLFESIRQEKEKFSTILGQMVEGVFLIDRDGKVTLSNPAANSLLGCSLENVSWKDLERDFEIKPSWHDITVSLGGAGGIDFSRKTASPLVLSGIITQFCTDRGQVMGHLVVLADVTDERREAQLKRTFLSLVAHKLKTPLVAIRGFAPMLLDKAEELSSFQRTAIETIDRNSIVLTSLVEKITWFATLESDEMALTRKKHSIEVVIDAAIGEMAAFLQQAGASIVRDASLRMLPSLEMDNMWMKETFRNLIENAIKFNVKNPPQLVISGAHADGATEISFRDNGPGIPPEEHAKIFQKFYQIESSFTGQVQGMGLGLALVKRVVESHSGQVRVESVPGQGSTFIVRMPSTTT